MANNRKSANLYLWTLLVSAAALSSCQKNSPVELAAEAARSRLQIGGPLAAALSSLKEAGFSCQTLADRSKEIGRPSFFCGKMIEEKRWLGLMTDYHRIRVIIDDDGTSKVESAEVKIDWGGLRGL